MHFPREIPIEDVKVVIGYLRGDGTEVKAALDSGLWVVGCAVQFLPADPMPMQSMTDEGAAKALEGAIAVGGGQVEAFPWATVFAIVWPLVQKWLFK